MLPASIKQKRQTPALNYPKCNYRLSLRGGSAYSSTFSSRNLQHRNTATAMLRRALQWGSTKRLTQNSFISNTPEYHSTSLNSVLSHLGFHKLLAFKGCITTKRHRFRPVQTSQSSGLAPINPFNYTIQKEVSYQAIGSYQGTRGASIASAIGLLTHCQPKTCMS